MKVGNPKEYPASLICLHEMLLEIRNAAIQCGIPKDSLNKIELASEEALVNIIKHGFINKKGIIKIICEFKENGFKIILQDNGISFNPVLYHSEYPYMDEAGIGGWGIKLILNAMDAVEYSRDNDFNSLTLIMSVPSSI